jgi:type II secretory pathway pseudopilin PulG
MFDVKSNQLKNNHSFTLVELLVVTPIRKRLWRFIRGKSASSFTLVELLVVIGILAVLTAAVILIINPVEYIRQARDVTRMSDLGSINKALSVLETQGITSFGTASTVYVSIADNASSTCGSLGLPALPSGWSYACVSSTNLQKTDGNGWIPVNFTQSTALAFSNLPLDPVNTTSTGNYYTYTPGGSWELATSMESSKYKLGGGDDRASSDGGIYSELYEVGSDKTLLPVDYVDNSLIGYWSFDFWSDSTNVFDNSGKGTGTWHGTGSTRYVAHGNGWTANFNGTDDYIDVGRNISLSTNPFTVSLWYKGSKNPSIILSTMPTGNYNGIAYFVGNVLTFSCQNDGRDGSRAISDNIWHMITIKRNGNTSSIYVDGTVDYEGNFPACNADVDVGQNLIIGKNINTTWPNREALGLIDDVRVYNRALSTAEIQAIYNATK